MNGNFISQVAHPLNLLDNSDFTNPINQRGQSSYYGSWTPCIDRWITRYSDENKKFWVSSGNISIPIKTQLIQGLILDKNKYIGKSFTLAIKISDSRTLVGTGIYNGDGKGISVQVGTTTYLKLYSTANNNYLYFMIENTSDQYFLPVYWVALYEGVYNIENYPDYYRKGKNEELLECQKYLRIWNFDSDFRMNGYVTNDATELELPFTPPLETNGLKLLTCEKIINTNGIVVRGVSGYCSEATYDSPYKGNLSMVSIEQSNGKLFGIILSKPDHAQWNNMPNNTPINVVFNAGFNLILGANF